MLVENPQNLVASSSPAPSAARAGCRLPVGRRAPPASGGAPNTVIDRLAGSRPSRLGHPPQPADRAGRIEDPLPMRGNQPSQYSTMRFKVWSVSPPSRIGGCGCCGGFGYDQTGSKFTNSPWNDASSCGPQRLHRQHVLAHHLEAGIVADAVVLHLLDVPAAADAENEPAARERSRLAMVLAVTIGSCCGTRQTPVPSSSFLVAAAAKASATNGSCVCAYRLGNSPPPGNGLRAAHRDVGVLAYEQRLEAARLKRAAQFAEVDAVIGREVEDAYTHG